MKDEYFVLIISREPMVTLGRCLNIDSLPVRTILIAEETPEALSLILVGGGHAHALFIKKFAMNPWKGVRLTLVSPDFKTPYSGMLPGLVAGVYQNSEAFIDLYKLCQFAQVRFIKDEALRIDSGQRLLYLKSRPPLSWDAISVNVGSQPVYPDLPGFRSFAVGVKPVSPFLDRISGLFDRVDRTGAQSVHIAILGGGVAGVEVALNLNSRIKQQNLPDSFSITVIHSEAIPASELGNKASLMLTRHLKANRIRFESGRQVSRLHQDRIEFESGDPLACDLCILCTSATGFEWIRNSGLPVTDKGFLEVDSTLQVLNLPGIFGAGDCVQVQGMNLAKSGVYAVRQAAPLFENVRRYLSGICLKPLTLQKHFLKLVGTGDGSAIAARGGSAFQGTVFWTLKERIDRAFMEKLNPKKPMKVPQEKKLFQHQRHGVSSVQLSAIDHHSRFRCLGCGAKWDGLFLSTLFDGLEFWVKTTFPSLKNNLDIVPDDAVVMDVPPGMRLVQTVDYMPALTKDFTTFGRILANHCLNDLYAMGARPFTVQLILNIPFSDGRLAHDDAFHLIWGLLLQLNQLGFARLVGGHTAQSPVFSAGLLCNGLIRPGALWSKSGACVGDRLVLTKPLGTGVLFAAAMKMQMASEFPGSALDCMLKGHEEAARLAESFQLQCATDITGFGLGGHLMELAKASDVSLSIETQAVPLLNGVSALLELGFKSSLHEQNKEHGQIFWQDPGVPEFFWDPQTSGPLLFAVPAKDAPEFLRQLVAEGYPDAAIIGTVIQKGTKASGYLIAD